MIPVQCRTPHRPPESYGDCLRACVASVMEMDAALVPHFVHDDPPADVAFDRMREWMVPHGYAPFTIGYPGRIPLDELLRAIGEHNPGTHYILIGGTGEGNHVVVCRNDKVVHNPAWYGNTIIGPGDEGDWIVIVVAKL